MQTFVCASRTVWLGLEKPGFLYDVETAGFRISDSSSTAAESRTALTKRPRFVRARGNWRNVFGGGIPGLILRDGIGDMIVSELNRAFIFNFLWRQRFALGRSPEMVMQSSAVC